MLSEKTIRATHEEKTCTKKFDTTTIEKKKRKRKPDENEAFFTHFRNI